jgi:hypothetical protein
MSVLREIVQKVKELLDDLETLEKEEKTTDFEYPFKIGDTCFFINVVGEPVERKWSNHVYEENAYKQGHIFKTKQEVYKERDKRDLLMRFNEFRDKCNGDWKPDWEDKSEDKFCILFNHESSELKSNWCSYSQPFSSFGFFKNIEDANRAIELFGDEIVRLWVDE